MTSQMISTQMSTFLQMTQNYIIQEDLNHLLQWSNQWLLPFNIEKCKVLHYGKVNPKNDYMCSILTKQSACRQKLKLYNSQFKARHGS